MRIAIIGLGRMGRALADRLLDDSHEVSVWNRTPGRAAELQERGARVLGSVDDVHEESDAVLLCLADDRSTLDVATPKGEARASWAQTLVVNTATVAPDAITALVKAYGDRFVAAEILGAPQASARVLPHLSLAARRQPVRRWRRCGTCSPVRSMSVTARRPRRS
jgi:3-hydroxyisobutyrate dehydrogenase